MQNIFLFSAHTLANTSPTTTVPLGLSPNDGSAALFAAAAKGLDTRDALAQRYAHIEDSIFLSGSVKRNVFS